MRVVLSWPDDLLKPSPLMLFKWQLISVHWIEHILEGMHTSNLCLKLCLFPCAHYIQCHWCLNVHMLLLMWWGGLHGLHGQLERSFQFHSHVNLLFIFLPPPLSTPLFWLAYPLGLAMQEIFRKYSKPLSLNITLSVLFLLNIAVPVLLFPNCRNGLEAFFILWWISVGKGHTVPSWHNLGPSS